MPMIYLDDRRIKAENWGNTLLEHYKDLKSKKRVIEVFEMNELRKKG
jgi:hypothetical protein